jgi:hypothetical protein
MKTRIVQAAALLPIIAGGCSTPSPDKVMQNEQTRFEEQQKRYPDRESREQEKAADIKARR